MARIPDTRQRPVDLSAIAGRPALEPGVSAELLQMQSVPAAIKGEDMLSDAGPDEIF